MQIARTMHYRTRVKWKMQMKEYKDTREKQRKNMTEYKKYLDYIFKRQTNQNKPLVLHTTNATTGEAKVIDDQEEIESAEQEYTERHMGKNRTAWYMINGKPIPEFNDSKVGRKWRHRVQQGTLRPKDWRRIPK